MYDHPAPNRGRESNDHKAKDPDWENWSLPLAGGYFGINIFGRTDTERIQVTEASLANPYPNGVNNFAEIYLDINHPENDITCYSRDLILNDATAHVRYTYKGVVYEREYFTSYPDAVMAVKLSASAPGNISFALRAETPYLKPFGEAENMGKSGQVTAKGNKITLTGEMEHYCIQYEGQIQIITQGGTVTAQGNALYVAGADTAVILMAVGTNYAIREETWDIEPRTDKLAANPHPHVRISQTLRNAASIPYDQLRQRHVADYTHFFNRVNLDIGGQPGLPTDQLLDAYKKGRHDPYLEELYFQFGRYLLISTSRKGALPGNLQGLWNQYDSAPWSAGYWHNINIQMNYWPTFTTNLAEMFESYADMNKAFRKQTLGNADYYLDKMRIYDPNAEYVIPMAPAGTGQNGWAVGTGGWPYWICWPGPGSHSGPGTGGLTAKLFWDYYDYTRDENALRETVYPALLGMANFLSKTVVKKGDLFLVHPSSSPEQRQDPAVKKHYQTTGCAFDQQMVYETHKDLIAAAEALGIEDEVVTIAREQVNYLDPVIIGGSGQIKEYREENLYGEIGDPKHRHISQLMALSPGQTINSSTPEWIEAAKVTLNKRGDQSTGWAIAHRFICWARVQDGARAYLLYQTLLKTGTLNNLWDTHPPFQIDGNFGGTAGVAEMLLQSNGNIIEPLAALPPAWANGSFNGLVARGNFVISCEWAHSRLTTMTVTARVGGVCQIRYPGIINADVTDENDEKLATYSIGNDLAIQTTAGRLYLFDTTNTNTNQ